MDPGRFYRESRVLLVAGKGGVGKTTFAATIAAAAALRGEDVLLFSLGDAFAFPALFGHDFALTSEEQLLFSSGKGRVRGRLLQPDAILLEYLLDHGFGRIARRLGEAGVLEVISSSVPGIKEVLVLGKIRQLERADAASCLVLELPASGHATRFLTSATGLGDAARSGPLRSQAEAAAELLADADRCQLLLVTIPEETPVNEIIETAFTVEDRTGVTLGPVVVNDCLPVIDLLDTDPVLAAAEAAEAIDATAAARLSAAAQFRLGRQQLQDDQLHRLAAELPLAQLRLPHLFVPVIDLDSILVLAALLDEGLQALPA